MTLSVGDKAPAFKVEDQHGDVKTNKDFAGSPYVIYFYPKADTPGCTTQSCALSEAEADLSSLNASVIGVSPDNVAKQKKFDDKYSLGFTLLADEDHAVAESYDVWGEKSLYGKKYFGIIRSAFVVDAKGKIAGAFYKVSPKDTVPNVVEVLKNL
ncbi:MAG TPA: thioredoxin-dependent thiol peroxidase [Acidimicrobiia bacterium]|nr:thioredoxin-dependent thiol peroxidase [Acidimicrobiia bacterium]